MAWLSLNADGLAGGVGGFPHQANHLPQLRPAQAGKKGNFLEGLDNFFLGWHGR